MVGIGIIIGQSDNRSDNILANITHQVDRKLDIRISDLYIVSGVSYEVEGSCIRETGAR